MRREEKESWVNVCAKWRSEEKQRNLKWRMERRQELAKLGGDSGNGEESKDRRIQLNRQKIENSKFNPEYKGWKMGQGRAQYLESEFVSHQDKGLLARYRTRAEVGAAYYWMQDDKRLCKVCRREEEAMKHVIEECDGVRVCVML